MSAALTALAVAALLGTALVGGIFYAFSSFVMGALARLPAAGGIAAMQAINVVVLGRSFLGLFLGTALGCVGLVALALLGAAGPAAPWFVAGAVAYLLGTVALTGLGNVPLNERLAGLAADDPDSAGFWAHYLVRWTRLNTLRTAAAAGAALLIAIGLLQG